MIGFKDHPKPCNEYVVIRAYFTSLTKSAVLVWDPRQNKIEMTVRDDDDAAYTAWLSGKTASGSNLFGGRVSCGFATNWRIYWGGDPLSGQQPSGCQLLIPGGIDIGWVNHPIYNYIYNDILAMLTNLPASFILPECAHVPVQLPGSPTAYTGFRTRSQAELFGAPDTEYDATRDLYFYGPLGLLGKHDGVRSRHYVPGYEYYGGPTIGDWHMIPDWRAATNPSWTPEKNYAQGRHWYGTDLKGQYSARTIANVCMVHYTSCDYHWQDWVEDEGADETWTFASQRTVHVQAQAVYDADGTTGKGWVMEGRNATLEEAITDLIDYAYNLNGVPVNEIRDCQLAVAIMQ